MNIFYLHKDPEISAKMHCDKHVVKMIIEYAQLMSTAHRILDGDEYEGRTKIGRRIRRWKHPNKNIENTIYKASHINHPSAVWARTSVANYVWLYNLFEKLCDEYTFRYGKKHSVEDRLPYLNIIPNNINPDTRLTEMPQCMPDYCKIPNQPIAAYKNYYIKEKVRFATWKNRSVPLWFQQKDIGI